MTPDEIEILRRRAKAELRKRLRALRSSTPASAIAARSVRIVAALEELTKDATRVALFWPIMERHEVDLRALDRSLRARGARVAYPAIDPETGAMSFRWVDDPDAMREEGYGFLEPAASAPVADDLEIIVCPALAADPRGHRLGYGAGYYDRALARARARSIAVVFDFQLLPEVPAGEHDVPVHVVVTDARTVVVPA